MKGHSLSESMKKEDHTYPHDGQSWIPENEEEAHKLSQRSN